MALAWSDKDVPPEWLKYEYIRFTVTDLQGVSRGKTATGNSIHKFHKDGFGIWAGTVAYGCHGEIPYKTLADVIAAGNPNVSMEPDLRSLHPLPHQQGECFRGKVGQVLCVTWQADGAPQQQCPRQVALRLLENLSDLGYTLHSAFEMEFKVYHTASGKPLFEDIDACSHPVMMKFEPFLKDMDYHLYQSGIMVETFQVQDSTGQFEFNLEPQPGISMADHHVVFKTIVREVCRRKELTASFMSRPEVGVKGNSAHFNFSLWDTETKKNIFYDGATKDGLSSFAHHFIAGLLKHAPALTALCSPTVNCYRRLHRSAAWTPGYANWGLDDRGMAIRAKVGGQKGTYIENRLPSGLSNSYLVMAATLAAGLDGVEERLECPPPFQTEGATKLPTTLEEALKALEEDNKLISKLGEKFVVWFLGVKREIDLVKLKDTDITVEDEDQILKERDYYESRI